MNVTAALIIALATLAWLPRLRAQPVLVTGVEGQVLYGAAGSQPARVVQAGERFGPGTFSAGATGILYLSAFDGSELRLSESGTLRYDGGDRLGHTEGPGENARSNFHLLQGKVQIAIKVPAQPSHGYRILLPQASAAMASGQCVMCLHGGDTFLFVARGAMVVTDEHYKESPPGAPKGGPSPPIDETEPVYGAIPVARDTLTPQEAGHAQILVGNGQVGVIGVDGDLRIAPLSALQAGTQTCLLAGFKPEVVEGSRKSGPDTGVPSTPNRFRRRFVIVSPTQ